MQDRYVGDVGDYVKLALLRSLSPGYRLGIAWYLNPDEGHNLDGRHTAYLNEPKLWRHLDEVLFDRLYEILGLGRSISSLERSGVLNGDYHRTSPACFNRDANTRDQFRVNWFKELQATLSSCGLIFSDPDNGLVDDDPRRRRLSKFGKHMPLNEALSLAVGRTVVVYHHNSRFRGGHDREVDHWLDRLGEGAFAVRANAFSCRTFFVLNPTADIRVRAIEFCKRWSAHRVRYYERNQALCQRECAS
jgi:hypothetical protein